MLPELPDHTPPSSAAGQRRRRRLNRPDPATPLGAVVYAVLGGLVVWLLVDVLPHHVQFHLVLH